MRFLNEANRQAIRERLGEAGNEVTLHIFTQGDDEEAGDGQNSSAYSKDTVDLMEEVAEAAGNIQVRVYEPGQDMHVFTHYGITEVPTIMPMADRDVGIRFVGLPHGYEFASFLDTVAALRNDEEPEVSTDLLERLAHLQGPTNLKVFYTPTCPHCPRAVRNAIQLARASDEISAELIESLQFPHLRQTYQVYAVPRTVINDIAFFDGAGTVEDVVSQIEAAHRGEGFEEQQEGDGGQGESSQED